MKQSGTDVLVRTLLDFKRLSEEYACDAFYVFATASLRRASNAGDVVRKVRKETGLDIDLIPAEKEAELSFRSVMEKTVRGDRTGVFSDMGGGSTELVFFRGGKREFLTSLPMGCLSLYRSCCRNDYPEGEEWKALETAVGGILDGFCLPPSPGDTLYLIGGSARALGCLYRHAVGKDGEEENGFAMTKEEFFRIPLLYKGEARETIRELYPERFRMILPAFAAYRVIIERLGIGKIVISTGCMREGYLLSLLEKDKE